MSLKDGVPFQRYAKDVAGMPCFAAVRPFQVMLQPEAMASYVPQNFNHCAIAEGAGIQLHTPYVEVGRHRTDLAMPHPKGVAVPDYDGLWAVIRFKNPMKARKVIIAADREELDTSHAVMLELSPPNKSDLPNRRATRGAHVESAPNRSHQNKGIRQRDNSLTLAGVRSLIEKRA